MIRICKKEKVNFIGNGKRKIAKILRKKFHDDETLLGYIDDLEKWLMTLE